MHGRCRTARRRLCALRATTVHSPSGEQITEQATVITTDEGFAATHAHRNLAWVGAPWRVGAVARRLPRREACSVRARLAQNRSRCAPGWVRRE